MVTTGMQNKAWPLSSHFLPIQHSSVLPKFDKGNMTNYFITRITCDSKSANDFKNINSSAFPLFKDGRVQKIEAFTTGDNTCTFYQAICLPEMKKSTTYIIRIVLHNISGDIEYAQCGCAAGAGPKGSCKHIAAMCYALEDFSRIHQLRDHVSCTSQLQTWNQPGKRNLDAAGVDDIRFVKMEYGKAKRPPMVVPYDPRPIKQRCTTKEEVQSLRQSLECKGNVALLHVLPSANTELVPSVQRLPLSSRSSLERVRHVLKQQAQPLSLYDIFFYCEKFVNMLTLSPTDTSTVESATRKQGDCKRWYEERYGRLTASGFGEVVKCRKYEGHVQTRIYPTQSHLSTSAILWGKSNEDTARKEYKKRKGQSLKVRESGLFISPQGFLASTPDGIICDENDSPLGILEIKCPYTQRNLKVIDACKKTSFFCEMDEKDRSIHLKKTHNYYYQVQGQMAVAGLQWCDFVVWTLDDIFVERINFDEAFWKNQCYSKLHSFYYGIMFIIS